MNKNVKTNCVACSCELVDPNKNYLVRGNYCAACNAKMNGKSVKRRLEEIDRAREEKIKKEKFEEETCLV